MFTCKHRSIEAILDHTNIYNSLSYMYIVYINIVQYLIDPEFIVISSILQMWAYATHNLYRSFLQEMCSFHLSPAHEKTSTPIVNEV